MSGSAISPDWLASIKELRGMTVVLSLISTSTSTFSRLGDTLSTPPTGTPRICRGARGHASCVSARVDGSRGKLQGGGTELDWNRSRPPAMCTNTWPVHVMPQPPPQPVQLAPALACPQ